MIENVYDDDKLKLALAYVPGAAEYLANLAGTYLIPMMGDTGDWWKVVMVYLGIEKRAEIQLKSGEIFSLDR